MLIALIVSINLLCGISVLFWLCTRRNAVQAERITFLEQEKQKFDSLTSMIMGTVTNGGWLTVMHNGKQIPFGPLLDKMECDSKGVN